MRRAPLVTGLLLILTVAAAAASLLQYFRPGSLAHLPIVPVAASLAAVFVAWLASRGIERLATGLNVGRHAWQRRIRQTLRVEPDQRFREADLLAALLHLAVWLPLPLVVLHFWGLSRASLDLLRHMAWTGFPIGKIQLVPAQLLMGAILLVVLATLIRWLTGVMENRWLARTPMETHTRESVATLTGYALFVVAALLVLSYVGLDLTKLAFIAGALSVGIGFGLQTIVNNFVSGLILLFEQPVRSGNYITVGETEGFVRRIRIRATEIETLDRITVVVPNSELLTQHVKNWNLRDRYGRLRCPVGVAYGSDVQLVQRACCSRWPTPIAKCSGKG
ncbi:mechanosensitive ion channel family protein [Salinisphaera sp. RV14]|uniref:mechanosensitive ion channel family protein n=1 Tax=Salinisphaera sp. RV14 TaxID=3454140 RepID=UPI003F83BBD5